MTDITLSPFIFWPLIALLGLIVGSHLHVVIDRLPRMLGIAPVPTHYLQKNYNLAWPRSHCPHCGTTLSIKDLIPLLSFIWLRAKCRHCQQPIAWSYPFIEILTAVAFVVLVMVFGIQWMTLAAMILTSGLIVLAAIDNQHHILPDQITLLLLWIGLLVNLEGTFVPIGDAVIGASLGYGSLWSVYHVHQWITGRQGLGYGDFKLLAMLGAWLGWEALPLIVVIGCACGLLYALYQWMHKRLTRDTPLPLGTFLAIAGWIVLCLR